MNKFHETNPGDIIWKEEIEADSWEYGVILQQPQLNEKFMSALLFATFLQIYNIYFIKVGVARKN